MSNPDHVIGDGTAESCTSAAVVETVALGGVITFNCGSEPITIELEETAKIRSDTGTGDEKRIVIDGGGLVTLSGKGERRILYMNTCDKQQKWTTSHCQNQDHPKLTVQNISFANGDSSSEEEFEGGGAIWARGGRLKVVNSSFFNNVCKDVGPDLGGGAIRALSQWEKRPVYVVESTFGGEKSKGNVCSNGGALSSIGVSWTVVDSLLSYNKAIGNGGNPAKAGTPGGGSGGAIYNDGNKMTLAICGTTIEHNEVNAFGSAIFFVSNNHTGNIVIQGSTITNNVDVDTSSSWNRNLPQIARHGDTPIDISNSTVE